MSLVYSAGGAMPLPQLAWTFDGTTTDYVSEITPLYSGSAHPGFRITTGTFMKLRYSQRHSARLT